MTTPAPTSLKLDGEFYPRFIADREYAPDALSAIQETVAQLLAQPTSVSKPGMLLGKVQSGKTKTFMGAIGLAFDNSFDVCVVLTKGTRALAKQTFERLQKEFFEFAKEDLTQIFDIMTLPPGLTGYELNQKLIFVVKKQTDNLDRLIKAVFETYPELSEKKFLIIDDEADYATIGFRRTTKEGLVINKIAGQIDELRMKLKGVSFLQVTATPYSLYLQPEDLKISANQQAFKPVRPAFTSLVPVHSEYVGGDYYFYESQEDDSVASFLHVPVSLDELETLKKEDRRSFRIEDCLTSPKIKAMRDAVVNFIVGGCIRRLQSEKNGKPKSKFSFIIHTEAGTGAHSWQEKIVSRLKEELEKATEENQNVLNDLIAIGYADLSRSISQHLSKTCANSERQGKVWCIIRKNRNVSRLVKKGHAKFSDAPDTAQDEGKVARQVATDLPVLLLLKQNGAEALDWRGAPFYWPVLSTPKNTQTAIFASDVQQD